MKRAAPPPELKQPALIDVTGRSTTIVAPVAVLPNSPGTLPRPAYLVWCALRAKGPMPLAGTGRLTLHGMLKLEHDMDPAAVEKALKQATAAGWVEEEAGGGGHSPRYRGIDPPEGERA